ncbi:MAG: hypothetical protein ACRC6M_05355, partial [Microcystaceae cyanobacterium]
MGKTNFFKIFEDLATPIFKAKKIDQFGFKKATSLLLLGISGLLLGTEMAQAQSLIPMELYWSDRRSDSLATATKKGKQEAVGIGYDFVRIEACIFPTAQPKTIALNLYRQAKTGENWTAVKASGAGYSV